MYRIMSFANSNSFNSSFPICILFTSVFSLIAVARTFKTILNTSNVSENPCLFELRGKVFRFHHGV